MPTLAEASDVFVWRQEDAIKNAISMAANSYYSHKDLQKKNSRTQISMLKDKGIEFHLYPDFFKSGTYGIKELIEVEMPIELKGFKGNENKDSFVRTNIKNYSLPRLRKIDNYEDYLFKDVFIARRKSLSAKLSRKSM